jgi:hypothetical protein
MQKKKKKIKKKKEYEERKIFGGPGSGINSDSGGEGIMGKVVRMGNRIVLNNNNNNNNNG